MALAAFALFLIRLSLRSLDSFAALGCPLPLRAKLLGRRLA
jgi:hypothetical protein